MSWRVCCAAQDVAGNVGSTSACILPASDTTSLEARNLTARCAGDDVVQVSFIASWPSRAAYVIVSDDAAAANLSAVEAKDLLRQPPLEDIQQSAVASGVLSTPGQGVLTELGACALENKADYVLLLALQSLTANATFSSVQRLTLNAQSLCSVPQPFACDPPIFVDVLQPRLQVTSGPGLLVGRPSFQRSDTGISIAQVEFRPPCMAQLAV